MAELQIRDRVALHAAACALLLASCQTELGFPSDYKVYKLYPGPVRPASELACIEFDQVLEMSIDGLWASRQTMGFWAAAPGWRSVEVLPGRHFVIWDREFHWPVSLNYWQTSIHEPGVWVELEAGHTYKWRYHQPHFSGDRQVDEFAYLQDEATGLVLVGGPICPGEQH